MDDNSPFLKEVYDKETVDALLKRLTGTRDAEIFRANTDPEFNFQVRRIVVPYNTARDENNPIVLGLPFRSLYVMDTNRPQLKIKFKPDTRDTFQSAMTIRNQTQIDFPSPVAKGYFFWDAQALNTNFDTSDYWMDILLSLNGSFRSSLFIGGERGVKTDIFDVASVNDGFGTAWVQPATAAEFGAASDIDRSILIYWDEANTDALHLGTNNSVRAAYGAGLTYKGIPVQPGEFFRWKNRSALWGYSTAGGNAVVTYEY